MQPSQLACTIFAGTATTLVATGVLTAWADPIAGHCLNAASLLLAAVWLVRYGLPKGVPWLVIPLLWVSTWGVAQVLFQWTAYPYETWNAVTGWLARTAILYIACATLREERLRHTVLSIFVWFGGLLSVVATMQWFTGDGRVFWLIPTAYHDEVMGSFLNRDHYAVVVELLLPVALSKAVLKPRSNLYYGMVSAVLYASVVGTGSRAGTIFVSLETAVVIAHAFARNSREYGRLALVIICIAVCSLAVGWQYVWIRFHAVDLFAFRREMALATIQMIQARPLTGFGLGSWPTVYPSFALFDPPGYFMNHAHNDWLEWTSDGGIALTLGLLSIVYSAVSFAKRNVWSLGIVSAFLHATVDFPMQKDSIAVLTFFLLGVAAAGHQDTLARTKMRESFQYSGH